MNKLLHYGLPAALGLLLASPAMAQSGGYNNQMGQNQMGQNGYESGNWHNSQGQNWNGRDGNSSQSFGQNNWNNGSNWNGGNGQTYGQNNWNGNSPNYGQGNANEQAVSQGFVAHLQRRLQQEGVYNGNIDGMWGPNTQTALQQFQQQHNMRPTGQINMPTLEALNMTNGGGQYGQNGNYQTFNRGYSQGRNYTSSGNYEGPYTGNGWNGRGFGNNAGGSYNSPNTTAPTNR
jgi:hypothetical protein